MVAHLRKVSIEIGLEGDTDPETRKLATEAVDRLMPSIAAECPSWSPALRRCMTAIVTERDVYTCERHKQEEQGIDMSGPSCERVAAHMMRLVIEPIGGDDKQLLERMRTRFDDACAAMPRSLKICVLAATTSDEVTRCPRGVVLPGTPR